MTSFLNKLWYNRVHLKTKTKENRRRLLLQLSTVMAWLWICDASSPQMCPDFMDHLESERLLMKQHTRVNLKTHTDIIRVNTWENVHLRTVSFHKSESFSGSNLKPTRPGWAPSRHGEMALTVGSPVYTSASLAH